MSPMLLFHAIPDWFKINNLIMMDSQVHLRISETEMKSPKLSI